MNSVNNDIHQFESKAPFVRTGGRVSTLDCDNHGKYFVSYTANGTTYTQSAANVYLKENCSKLKNGDDVDVWVSQKDAQYVSFKSPEIAVDAMASELWAILFAGYPVSVLFLSIALYLEKRMR